MATKHQRRELQRRKDWRARQHDQQGVSLLRFPARAVQRIEASPLGLPVLGLLAVGVLGLGLAAAGVQVLLGLLGI